ncbi:MAG: hypothetical protein HGB26_03730 [Desulfobulbaceae bacterium]|nr:hypothetical protein [Desulfobulbaceae bacterium]
MHDQHIETYERALRICPQPAKVVGNDAVIDRSFLDKDRQATYKELIMKKYQQIRLDS